MTQYLISEELRDSLIGLIVLLKKNSETTYHKYSNKYTHRIILENGKELRLPFLTEIQKDLKNLEEVIETNEYNTQAEELLIIAKEMGLL